MGWVAQWLAEWLARRRPEPPPCRHPNGTERRWLDRDRTPMVEFQCPDCGFHDRGHVYADPDEWVADHSIRPEWARRRGVGKELD